VTGGAGFMGSHVADVLIAMDHQVVVLDDLSGGRSPMSLKKPFLLKGVLPMRNW
jgi:nucleoside-diphosphate-sugar epimerase